MDTEKNQTSAASKRKAGGKRVGKEQIEKARAKLEMYKAAKGTINETIKYNEQWFRRRYQEYCKDGIEGSGAIKGDTVPRQNGEIISPNSAWLFNSILNYHADAMDNFPRANVLAREKGDELEAYKLSLVLPAILQRMDFEQAYDNNQYTKGYQGWCVYWMGWDKDANGGKGDLYVKCGQLLNLYWDQEVSNIQDSSDVFYLHQVDRDELLRDHPELEAELTADDRDYQRQPDNPKNAQPTKATVVDWYYKKRNKAGKRVLHYCRFVSDTVLYATENDKELSERGLYDHGEYPFEIDVLYPLEGQVAGFGKVAVGANTQIYIDLISKALLQNALWSSRPRYFKKKASGINESDFLDVRKSIIEYEGDPNAIKPIENPRIDGNVLNLQGSMIDELRTNSGSTEVATGATPGGVTAASAIASLQEAQGKQGRDSNRASFRCFRRIIVKLIELIRQFYTEAHYFRVMGDDGEAAYISIDNKGLTTGVQTNPETGEAETFERHPVFDLEITTEKNSTYTRMAQNELMLSFFSAGFFNSAMADQSLACIKLMDFDGKEELISMIGDNMAEQEQKEMLGEALMQYAQVIDELNADRGVPSNYAQQTQAVVAQVLGGGQPTSQAPAALPQTGGESSVTKNARMEAASAASPT